MNTVDIVLSIVMIPIGAQQDSKTEMRCEFLFRGVQLLPYKFQRCRISCTTNNSCQLCEQNVPLVLTWIADTKLVRLVG